MKKFMLFVVVVVVASLALTACGVKFNTQPQTSSQTPDVLVVTATPVPIQTQSPTVSAPTSTPAPNATVLPTPTPEAVVTETTVRGWSRVGFENLPQPAGYPGWLFTIGDDRVPGQLAPFDLTLHQGQVALFQGTQLDASLTGGPSINQCYVALIVGPVNWVNGELKIGVSGADWHQTEGFEPLAWLAQRAADVSEAYRDKDPNCSLDEIQIWVYQP